MLDKKIIRYQLNSMGFILGLLMVLNVFLKIFSYGFLPIYSPLILLLIISMNRYYGDSLRKFSLYSLIALDRKTLFLSNLAYLLILALVMLIFRNIIDFFFFKNMILKGQKLSIFRFLFSKLAEVRAVRRGLFLKNIYRLVEYFLIVAVSIFIYTIGNNSARFIEIRTRGRLRAKKILDLSFYLLLRLLAFSLIPLAFINRTYSSQGVIGSRSFIISSKTLSLVDPSKIGRNFLFISNSGAVGSYGGSYNFYNLSDEIVYLNLGNLFFLLLLGLVLISLTYLIYRRKNEF